MIFRVVTLVMCGIIGGLLGMAAADRRVPTKIFSVTALNEPSPGGVLRVENIAWRDKSCLTIIKRLIFDKDHRFVVSDLIFQDGQLPLGQDDFIAPVPISPEAEPGDATYRVYREYYCNLLHYFRWPITDGPHDLNFKIGPRVPGPATER